MAVLPAKMYNLFYRPAIVADIFGLFITHCFETLDLSLLMVC